MLPVPLARKSKSAFETVVVITLSSIRITPLLNSAACTTRQGFVSVPRSNVFPTSGVRSLVKSATTLIVSSVVSPMRIFPPNVISPVTSMLPLIPKLPVTFVLANNSMLPVPTVLISKLLFVAVVSILLPTICISSVRNGPPTMSPVTYSVPPTVKLSLAVIGPVNVETPLTIRLFVVVVPVAVIVVVFTVAKFPVVELIALTTVNVVPSKVKLALSCNSPSVPASTIRPLVKSSILALAKVAWPLTSNVPVTFEFAKSSMLPVPTVLISKLLLLEVVSILLPTI